MISVNRINVSAQITKLKMAEDKCNDAIRKMKRAMAAAGESWKGSAGEAAQRVLEDLLSKTEVNRASIASMAATIQRVADEINQRDSEAAATIASSRK